MRRFLTLLVSTGLFFTMINSYAYGETYLFKKGDVTLGFRITNDNYYYANIEVDIQNNSSSTIVNSIQLTARKSVLAPTQLSGNSLDWNSKLSETAILWPLDSDIHTINTILSSPAKPGETKTIKGGLNINGQRFTISDISDLTYNYVGANLVLRLSSNGGEKPAKKPIIEIGSNKYVLNFKCDNIIKLAPGTYPVELIDKSFTDGTMKFISDYIPGSIVVPQDLFLTYVQSINYRTEMIPTNYITVNITGLEPYEVKAIVKNSDGYFDSTQAVWLDGSNYIKVPRDGNSTIIFMPDLSQSPELRRHMASDVKVINGRGTYSADFSGILKQGLRVGYLENTSNVTLKEAADHGYNVIVIAFGKVIKNANGQVVVRMYDNKFPGNQSAYDFTTDMQNAREAGVKYILLSVGGESDYNTFLPGGADSYSVANALIEFAYNYSFDGIDFDLEIEDVSQDYLAQLIQYIQGDGTLIVSCAPQLNDVGSDGIRFVSHGFFRAYDKALANGSIDYVFAQLYNTDHYKINNYDEKDAEFISASYNYILSNGLVTENTILVQGEPAEVGSGGLGTIYHNAKYANAKAAQLAVKQQKDNLVNANAPQFGGIMTWSINQDRDAGWTFSKNVFESQ